MYWNIIPIPLGVQKHIVKGLVHTELKVKYIGDEEWWTTLFLLLSISFPQLFILNHYHSVGLAVAIMDKTQHPLPSSCRALTRLIDYLSAFCIPCQGLHLLNIQHLWRHALYHRWLNHQDRTHCYYPHRSAGSVKQNETLAEVLIFRNTKISYFYSVATDNG